MAQDPRRIITPDSFVVAPELLGLPLASPSRRALALGIDLMLVAMLIQLGGLLLAATVAVVFWRAGGGRASGGFIRRGVRIVFRAAAAVVALITVLFLWDKVTERVERSDRSRTESSESGGNDFGIDTGNLNLAGPDAFKLMQWGVQLRRTRDSVEALRLADSMAALLRRTGATTADLGQMRDELHDAVDSGKRASVRHAIDRAFQPAASVASVHTLAASLAQAAERADSAAADSLRQELRNALAGAELRRLEARVGRQQRRIEGLESELARSRANRGVRTFFSSVADDLGLGFGWLAVYFTAFLALMRGQTPGKRLLGLRVVRLDARPITWFIAFERFGGYAASATLGLLGFLQVLWDRNRQGLHDKAVETVVIRLTRTV